MNVAFWSVYMGIYGGRSAVVLPPTAPGIEFTAPSERLHYTVPTDQRLHYTVDER